MHRITRFFEKSIFGLGVVIFGWIFLLNLFLGGIKYDCKNKCAIPNGLLLVIGFALIGLVIFLGKKYEMKIHKIVEKEERLIRILSVVLLIVEFSISLAISFATGWDAREVSWQADLVSQGDVNLDNEYFSHYPNNLLITFFYSLVFRFAGLFGLQMAGSVFVVVIQCFLSVLTGHLLYKVSKKMFSGSKIPMLIWLVYSLWMGLLAWYMITYSDPVGILFPVLILWMYQSMENGKAVGQKSVGIGIAAFIGYRIKPTTVIIYIALVIVLVLRLISDKERKTRAKQLVCLLLSFFVFAGIYQKIDIGACMGFELDKEQELTITHFVMMGLSEERNGIFDIDEVEYSLSFPDQASRQEANCKKIKQRLQNYGVGGLVNHIAKKTLINYNDGTFAWGKEAEFFAEEVEKPEWIVSKVLKDVYYNDGTYRVAFNTILQGFLLLILLGCLLNGITLFQKKQVSDTELIVMLALIGLFLFVTMFEARARYVYVYVPLYILMGMRGYDRGFCLLKNR